MNEDVKSMEYTIGFLSKKRDIVTGDINVYYENIEANKKRMQDMEDRIPILQKQIIALDKAIGILKLVEEIQK